MKKKNKKHKKHNKKRNRMKLSKREKRIMRVKRSLKKGAKKLRLSAKRTGAYVFGTLRKIFGNPYTKYGVMLTDVQLLGTGLDLKKGEKVGYISATNIPGGGVFVRPAKLRGIWKMASRDDSIYIKASEFAETILNWKDRKYLPLANKFGRNLRDNPGARYRVGGGYQTFTLEEAKKEADRIFREKGIIVSIEEYKAIPQVKPDWKYGIYTGRGIARNRKLKIGKQEQAVLNFARKYPGWHGFNPRKHTSAIVLRLAKKGLIELSDVSNQFREMRRKA